MTRQEMREAIVKLAEVAYASGDSALASVLYLTAGSYIGGSIFELSSFVRPFTEAEAKRLQAGRSS